MSDKSTSVGAGATRPKIVIERTYQARTEELWELWTTKKGFESWWGPEGFRVEVHTLEARVGGALHYDMIAEAPEQIAAMKQLGQPTSHGTRARFAEIKPNERLAITHVVDFVSGVKPYESTAVVEFFRSGDTVRMVILPADVHAYARGELLNSRRSRVFSARTSLVSGPCFVCAGRAAT